MAPSLSKIEVTVQPDCMRSHVQKEKTEFPILPYLQGLDYGMCVDSLDGTVRGDGVVRTEPEPVTGVNGANRHIPHVLTPATG